MSNTAYRLVNDLIKKGMCVKSIHRITDIPQGILMDLMDGTIKNLEPNTYKKILYFYCKFTNLK